MTTRDRSADSWREVSYKRRTRQVNVVVLFPDVVCERYRVQRVCVCVRGWGGGGVNSIRVKLSSDILYNALQTGFRNILNIQSPIKPYYTV